MPSNTQTNDCISFERGALVFTAPGGGMLRDRSRMQIVDVFALQVATGYARDPQGRLILESQSSISSGRSWSLAKATQLIRNDARPHRWVALQLDKRAWGLFWAGGGLQRCRELLAQRLRSNEDCAALVPATPEALLRLILEFEPKEQQRISNVAGASKPWLLVAITSSVWLMILALMSAGFLSVLDRQGRQIELLLHQAPVGRINEKPQVP